MNSIVNIIKSKIFYRKHPDTALRYLPIVDLINKEGWANSQILEIGSGSYGIAPYLQRQITGVDVDFSEPAYPLLTQVHGSAGRLPFAAGRFDLCLLSDVLEHLPAHLRHRCLSETVRVARKAVIISGPFGAAAFAQDQALAKLSSHPFFAEHLKYGLPDPADILSFHYPKVLVVQKIGESLNLRVRYLLMRLFVSRHKSVYYVYLKGLMVFVPLLRHFNRPPCYRSLFVLRLRDAS